MRVERRPVSRFLAYSALGIGSAVFSFPFLWMVCSSMKVDRELYPEKIQIFPEAPNAKVVSPFVDDRHYKYAVTNVTAPHMDYFREIIESVEDPFPEEVDRETAVAEVTKGFAKKMETVVRTERWIVLDPGAWRAQRERLWLIFDAEVTQALPEDVRTKLWSPLDSQVWGSALASVSRDPKEGIFRTLRPALASVVLAAELREDWETVVGRVAPGVPDEFVESLRESVSDQLETRMSRVLDLAPLVLSDLTPDQVAELPASLRGPLVSALPDEIQKGILDTVSESLWTQIGDTLREKVKADIEKAGSPEVVAELFDQVYRRMMIGQIRIRAYTLDEKTGGLAEQELAPEFSASERFQVVTPETVCLEDREDHGTPAALVKYDFSVGDRWRIEQTFDTEFSMEDLHRIRLFLRADDNWHRLHCYVEKLGKLYKSVRAFYPANYDWGTVTWQEPGPEDRTNKIKSWIHLRKIDEGTQYVRDPHKIRIALELEKSTPLQAWWGKITRNYDITIQHIPVWRYAATSLYLVILNIGLAVFSCSIVAYAIARLNWPGRDFCFVLMLATMMIPAQVTMIPGFLIWKNLGCYNTLVPLWLGAAFASPFSVFLLRQFLKGIPKDLEDAAHIDGAGYFRVYWHVMFPLVKPTLAVIAIGAFMGAWNNFMGPLIFIADQRLYPLAFGLYAFAVQVGNNPLLTMAGSFMMTVPIIIVFFFAQKYFIQGVTLTGMKG